MVVTGQLAVEINGERLAIPPDGEAVACGFDLTTAIFVEQEQGTDLQGCETTVLEQPRDQLEAVGAVIEVNGSEDGDDGILP